LSGLFAGAAAADVTPSGSVFLYGYPHRARFSIGVHDPLLASALYLSAGDEAVMLVCVDTIWLSKSFVQRVRRRIAEECGIATSCIMITATHTHSGPVTVAMLSNADDVVVPPANDAYLARLAERIVRAAEAAVRHAEPAEVAVVEAKCPDIGGNRHDPGGPTVDEIPIVAVRSRSEPNRWLGLMFINRVHPTVLHEDSLLISGDFPGLCRQYLQRHLLGADCAVLSPIGAAGNQSPRYVTLANTFQEAERLGTLLGKAIEASVCDAAFWSDVPVGCITKLVELPMRSLPAIEIAELAVVRAREELEKLKKNGATRGRVRTAECAVFGAEETVALARMAASGRLSEFAAGCLPAEIQVVEIGPWLFVGWPGEVFAEFAIDLRQTHLNARVITLANGELQGYLVTEEAVRNRAYEASNSVFASPKSGEILLAETRGLLERYAHEKANSHAHGAAGRLQ
jgi:hypothetical protein